LTDDEEILNSSGFTLLSGGNRLPSNNWSVRGVSSTIWNSTESGVDEAWRRGFNNSRTNIYYQTREKSYGHSVRCVKNLNFYAK